MSSILSLIYGHTSETSYAAVAQDTDTNFDKLNTSLFKIYPVLISPNWVKIYIPNWVIIFVQEKDHLY